jgi:hypothetical protein
MKVVGHEDISLEKKGISLSGCLEGLQESFIVGRSQIHCPAIIAPGHQVVGRPWDVDAQMRRHSRNVPSLRNLGKSDTNPCS